MTNYNFNQIPPDTYVSLVKAQQIRPRFRLSMLYQDESFKEDISDYLILTISRDRDGACHFHLITRQENLRPMACKAHFGLIAS